MRVIAGSAKGRQLRSVPGAGTRPITDRVKESLFDILDGDVVDSVWWDMFAGTGAVGIEALSRGAAHVRFTELHDAAIRTIKANLSTTNLSARAETRRVDSFSLLAAPADRTYHYVYVAPPQYQGLWSRALLALDQNLEWLTPDGWAIAQVDPKEYLPLQTMHLHEFDKRRYGTTLLLFYARAAT
jgi:16S rRNA (guanine(966)-N(2))-methyltransferase RsmD